MIDVDRILELKRRINKIAEEIALTTRDESEHRILEDAWDLLDKADIKLGELT